MSTIRELVEERRTVIDQIERTEFELDSLASRLEQLRRDRQSIAERIRDEVLLLPIAQAVQELTDDILDAEVIA